MVELWEILKVVNRKRVKEIQVAPSSYYCYTYYGSAYYGPGGAQEVALHGLCLYSTYHDPTLPY
jgi:hypothetical protein